MEDCMTELGAMWIEGACIPNLIFQLASQEGLIASPLKRYKLAENTTFFTDNGRAIDPDVAHSAMKTFQELIEAKVVLAELVGQSHNLGEFIERNLDKQLKNLPCSFRKDFLHVMGCLYNELGNRLGQDPCQVHPKALSLMQQLPGGRIRIPIGFSSVLAPLLRILPPCTIMYCKPVHYISWDPKAKTHRAKVVCSDKEEFSADYVIITTSLGVLKSEAGNMFCPNLPDKKADAIEMLGYGDVERIFIQYKKPFWVAPTSIGLGWPINEKLLDPDNWTRGLGELMGVPGSYSTLQGVVASNSASILSGTPSDRLITDFGNVMRQFTGDKSLPDPINIQRSNWVADPFFQGSFTYLGISSAVKHIDYLAEPVPNPTNIKDGKSDLPLLLFAGEATSREYFSTVHGARESGIREAQRIIDITKVLKGPPSCALPCPPCKTKG